MSNQPAEELLLDQCSWPTTTCGPLFKDSICSWGLCWAVPDLLSVHAVPLAWHTWLHPSPPAAPPLRSTHPGKCGEWGARRPSSHSSPSWRRLPRRALQAVWPESLLLPGSPPFPLESLCRSFGPPGQTEPCEAALARTPQRATAWCGQRKPGWSYQTPAGLRLNCGNKSGSLTWRRKRHRGLRMWVTNDWWGLDFNTLKTSKNPRWV